MGKCRMGKCRYGYMSHGYMLPNRSEYLFTKLMISPQKVRTDTKAMLEECTYNNGCISGVDCEGCAVEVIILVILVIMMMTMTLF